MQRNQILFRYASLLAWLFSSLGFAETEREANYAIIAPMAKKSLILDMANKPSGEIFLVGERGHILAVKPSELLNKTVKDMTWSQARVPTRNLLTSIVFISDQVGWAAGHDSVILVTHDGGQSWKTQFVSPEREQPLFDLLFLNENEGYAIGAYGLFLKTRDGGNTWNEVYIEALDLPDYGLPHFYRMIEFSGKILLMVGEAGLVARSEDGGANWKKIDVPYGGSLFDVCLTARNSTIAVGLRGNVLRSEDAGLTWDLVETPTSSTLTGCQLLPNRNLMLVGMDGTLLTSEDDGKSFSQTQHEDRMDYAGFKAISNEKVFLIGEGGGKLVDFSGKPLP